MLTIGGASAAPQTYVYAVIHPRYGNIGSFTETVDKERDVTQRSSELRIAVKILGIVVHREESSVIEFWRGARLAAMRSLNKINGVQTNVSGAVDQNSFVVKSASGTETVPAEVTPSDPWALTGTGPGVVVSMKSGKVEHVNVTGGEAAAIMIAGSPLATRHFRVDAASQPDRYDIWLDGNGVPVMFRSRESSPDPIDFVLTSSDPQNDSVSDPRSAPGAH